MFTSNELSAYLLMWTLVIWVSGHNQVSKESHIATLYMAIYAKGKSIMQSITMSLATLKNPALMLSAVIRGLGRIPTKTEYAYTSKCYYMLENVKTMTFEESLLWLENVESVIAMLWHLPSALPSKKDDNQKTQRIGLLAELIRSEYRESGRLPIWVDSILAGSKLEEVDVKRTAKGKKTNSVATIPAIGASVELYADKENESEGASPLIPQQRYTVAGLGIIAKRISNASGKQGSQIIECVEESLLTKLSVGKSFTVDTISGYKWVVVSKDKDAGLVYATWHKTTKPAAKEAQPAQPATKAKAKAKEAQPAQPAQPDIAAIVAAVLAAMGKA